MVKPGIYPDMDEMAYLFDRDSLSNTGAKKLLPPSCPSKFRTWVDTAEEEHKKTFDFGHVAHKLVLGKGAEFEVVQKLGRDKQTWSDAEDFTTKSAQEHRDAIRARGKVPVLRKDLDKASAMAEVVKNHPVASSLFSNGQPEVAAFWSDPETGIDLRARFDWLPDKVKGRRLIIPDYKTTTSAHPDKFAKAAADYGYHMQAAHYTEGAALLGLGYDPLMVFVAQEKEPPYEVNVIPLHDNALKLGRMLNDRARRIYRECMDSGQWPGYTPPDQIANPIELPTWYSITTEEYLIS